MRLVLISDTHGKHGKLVVPDGDVIIHAGDFTRGGTAQDITEFSSWYSELPHKNKILIAGNHDMLFERDPSRARSLVSVKITYLQDSFCIIDGLLFYGSPWQPRFLNWAFNVNRGSDLAAIWARIPTNVDVLITHGPPQGIGDLVPANQWQAKDEHAGCQDLADRRAQLTNLKLHVFGHIHEGAGVYGNAVNAASLNGQYTYTNPPIVFDI